MQEHTCVAVVDLVTLLSQAQAEIYIFQVVVVVGVEAAERVEDARADQHARGRHDLKATRLHHGWVLLGEADVDVKGIAGEAEYDAGVLNRPVWKQEPAPDRRRL